MRKKFYNFGLLLFLFQSTSYGQSLLINEICASNYQSYEDEDDEHGDWVEFYNPGNSSVNMGGMYLTDDYSDLTKFQIPTSDPSETTIGGLNHLVFWFDDESYKGLRHANFKLSNSGEQLALVASDGITIIDSMTYGNLLYDVTFGRTTNGSVSLGYFLTPTPDGNNTGGGFTGIAGKADYNLDAGFYPSPIQVELDFPDPQASIYYTINGNEPAPGRGILYSGPININSDIVLRARVYKANFIPGEITTKSYFINRTIDLPVMSIVTDSLNLWDENTGIYCFGVDDYDHYYPYYGANFWRDWKKPAHIEFFESSGAEVISQNLNLSLSGNTSRVYAQKSFNLEAKDVLGKNSISHQVFPQLQIADFKALKLRNGGSDWSSTGIRDAFNHTLLEGAMDVDHMTNRPVIVYLNGAYWGVMSLTEKIDENYLNEHYPALDKDSIDILFSNAEVEKGDANNYNSMLNFISANSLSSQSNYNYIKDQIDIPSFINYFEARIYYATTDWPNKNIKYWRPKDQSMKWRWIMWDTDRSDLLTRNSNHPCNYTHNTMAWATTSSSVASWAQFLLNNLLLNSEFKNQFITQFAHNINFAFCRNRVDSLLGVFRSRVNNELPSHINKWKNSNDTIDYFTVGYYRSLNEWNTEVDTIQQFFDNRARYMRRFIIQQFGISDTSRLAIAKIPQNGGVVFVDTIQVPLNACDLVYFNGYPITISAKANQGYVFSGWTTPSGDTLPITWMPNGDTSVIAYFEQIFTQPTIPSSNLSSSITNCHDIQLNWTSGNGMERIIVVRNSSSVIGFPVDYNAYSSDSNFGSGSDLGGGNFVVYSGTGNSCTITGLTQGETYYYSIFEYNGTVASNIKYNSAIYTSGSILVVPFQLIVSSTSSVICQGDSTTLTANGGVTYSWFPGNTLSDSIGASVIAMPTSTMAYTILASDSNGCILSSEISIVVNPLPSVILPDLNDICEDATPVILNQGIPSGGTYSGNGVSNGFYNPSLANIGTHLITYSFTDSIGCMGADSSYINVREIPEVNLGNDTGICCSNSITLDAGTGFNTYIWTTGATTQTILVDTVGIGIGTSAYSVTVSNAFNCFSSDEIAVTFDLCTFLEPLSDNSTILVFPNPFFDEIIVRFWKPDFSLSVTDVLGNLVYSEKKGSGEASVYLSVPSGIYFMRIQSGTEVHVLKLVRSDIVE